MPKALPGELRQAIINDLQEGRLSYEEIAAKRFGDGRKVGTISKIAKKENIPRKNGRPPKRKPFHNKCFQQKSPPQEPIAVENFDPEARLNIIDEALSQLKAILPECAYAKGMMEWSSALERLLEMRRYEEPPKPPETEGDGFYEALEAKVPEIWKDVDAEANAVQVDSLQHKTMETPDLVDPE